MHPIVLHLITSETSENYTRNDEASMFITHSIDGTTIP